MMEQHTTRAFDIDLQDLARLVAEMGGLAEKQIGESAGPAAQATAAGTGAGQNLAGAGLNVNLAPVLDVYRTPGNFDDQFQRSYSMNPQTVAGLGAGDARTSAVASLGALAKTPDDRGVVAEAFADYMEGICR